MNQELKWDEDVETEEERKIFSNIGRGREGSSKKLYLL